MVCACFTSTPWLAGSCWTTSIRPSTAAKAQINFDFMAALRQLMWLETALHPTHHATAQVVYVGKALLLQEHASLCRTCTAAANHDQLFPFWQLVHPGWQCMQRKRFCLGHGAHGDFFHLAHIDHADA